MELLWSGCLFTWETQVGLCFPITREHMGVACSDESECVKLKQQWYPGVVMACLLSSRLQALPARHTSLLAHKEASHTPPLTSQERGCQNPAHTGVPAPRLQSRRCSNMLQKGGKMRTVSVLTPEREGVRGHDSYLHGQETVGRHRSRQGVAFTM